MRAMRKVASWVAVGLTLFVFSAGCEEGVCDPCPANADGIPLCNTVEGTYYGEMKGISGDCGQATMLDGNARIDVEGVAAATLDGEADGDPITEIYITLTDEQGNNTRFKGNICDKTQDQAPFSYFFRVIYTEYMDIEGIQINNVLSGEFRDENGADPPVYTIDATYSVSLLAAENPESSCTMQASLETTPDE